MTAAPPRAPRLDPLPAAGLTALIAWRSVRPGRVRRPGSPGGALGQAAGGAQQRAPRAGPGWPGPPGPAGAVAGGERAGGRGGGGVMGCWVEGAPARGRGRGGPAAPPLRARRGGGPAIAGELGSQFTDDRHAGVESRQRWAKCPIRHRLPPESMRPTVPSPDGDRGRGASPGVVRVPESPALRHPSVAPIFAHEDRYFAPGREPGGQWRREPGGKPDDTYAKPPLTS